jgi:hypothetical protein
MTIFNVFNVVYTHYLSENKPLFLFLFAELFSVSAEEKFGKHEGPL